MANAGLDQNSRNTLIALSAIDGTTVVTLWADPVTHRLLVDFPGGSGSGTVTSVSVVTTNGLAGSVATATTTPAITLRTTITGILSGNGTAISAASTTGSGSVVLATTPTLVTPVLGVATGTSLALGGATIGSNALAVTGTTAFGGNVSIAAQASLVLNTNSSFITSTSDDSYITYYGNFPAPSGPGIPAFLSEDQSEFFLGFSEGDQMSIFGRPADFRSSASFENSINILGSITTTAWTTNGVRVKGIAAIYTDTSSSGTVPTAYSNVWGGNTIAASNPTTFTNYFGNYFKDPASGSNVTFTNKWSVGADSLKIGTSNFLTITPAGAVTILGSLSPTTVGAFTLTGVQTLSENTSIALDPAGSADGKYTGLTVTATAGYTQAFGDLVYLDPTDSRWEACDANSASGADGDSRGMIGMVVVAGTDGTSCTILLQGIIRADAKFPSFTINNPIYVSETAGLVTQTQPTTTDVVIRVVGFALTADEMYFNPSPDYITHT